MGVKVSGRGGTLLCVNYEHIDRRCIRGELSEAA